MFSNFLTNKFYTLSWLLYDSSKHRYFHLHRSEYEIFLFSDCEAWRGCYTKRTDKSKQTMLLIALECCFTFFKRLYVKSGKKFFVFVINFYPMNENVNCHSSSGVFRERISRLLKSSTFFQKSLNLMCIDFFRTRHFPSCKFGAADQVLRFGEQKTFWGGNISVFSIYSTYINFSGNNKIWGHKKFGGYCPECLPVATGPQCSTMYCVSRQKHLRLRTSFPNFGLNEAFKPSFLKTYILLSIVHLFISVNWRICKKQYRNNQLFKLNQIGCLKKIAVFIIKKICWISVNLWENWSKELF